MILMRVHHLSKDKNTNRAVSDDDMALMILPIFMTWLLVDEPTPSWAWQAFVCPYMLFMAIRIHSLVGANWTDRERAVGFIRSFLPPLIFSLPTASAFLGYPHDFAVTAYCVSIASIFFLYLIPKKARKDGYNPKEAYGNRY